MPDTGAPWNIPYADPTDLVRDWPDLSEDVADAVAAGLSAAGNAGIGSNVVQTIKTNKFTTSSATFTEITGFSATITPSSATSKILVIVDAAMGQSESGSFSSMTRLMRGATPIYIGDTDGSRTRATRFSGVAGLRDMNYAGAVFLDSPGVATATTYSMEARRGEGNSFLLNAAGNDPNNADTGRTVSSITLIEVAV